MQPLRLLAVLARTWRSIPLILGLLFKRTTPWKAKLLIVLAIVYLFLPYDLIPEWLMGAGLLDDVIIVTTLLGYAHRLAIADNDKSE